jgi:hypothetical protein
MPFRFLGVGRVRGDFRHFDHPRRAGADIAVRHVGCRAGAKRHAADHSRPRAFQPARHAADANANPEPDTQRNTTCRTTRGAHRAAGDAAGAARHANASIQPDSAAPPDAAPDGHPTDPGGTRGTDAPAGPDSTSDRAASPRDAHAGPASGRHTKPGAIGRRGADRNSVANRHDPDPGGDANGDVDRIAAGRGG